MMNFSYDEASHILTIVDDSGRVEKYLLPEGTERKLFTKVLEQISYLDDVSGKTVDVEEWAIKDNPTLIPCEKLDITTSQFVTYENAGSIYMKKGESLYAGGHSLISEDGVGSADRNLNLYTQEDVYVNGVERVAYKSEIEGVVKVDETGKIPVEKIPIAQLGGLELGETADTAYRGDRGKVAYEHTFNEDIHLSTEQVTKLSQDLVPYTSLSDGRKKISLRNADSLSSQSLVTGESVNLIHVSKTDEVRVGDVNLPLHLHSPNDEVYIGEKKVATSSDISEIRNILPLKADLVDGRIPTSQLPAYVSDVVEVESLPDTGEEDKIYITITDNRTYRWAGTRFVEISPSLTIGETSETAFRGDYGKVAYEHTSDTNIHVTPDDKRRWDGKADVADYVTYSEAQGKKTIRLEAGETLTATSSNEGVVEVVSISPDDTLTVGDIRNRVNILSADGEVTVNGERLQKYQETIDKFDEVSQSLSVKADLVNGKVPSSQIDFPVSLKLGTTSSTAYRGDLGDIAYKHSQDSTIHISETEREKWNAKQDAGDYALKSEIPVDYVPKTRTVNGLQLTQDIVIGIANIKDLQTKLQELEEKIQSLTPSYTVEIPLGETIQYSQFESTEYSHSKTLVMYDSVSKCIVNFSGTVNTSVASQPIGPTITSTLVFEHGIGTLTVHYRAPISQENGDAVINLLFSEVEGYDMQNMTYLDHLTN